MGKTMILPADKKAAKDAKRAVRILEICEKIANIAVQKGVVIRQFWFYREGFLNPDYTYKAIQLIVDSPYQERDVPLIGYTHPKALLIAMLELEYGSEVNAYDKFQRDLSYCMSDTYTTVPCCFSDKGNVLKVIGK